MKYERLLNLKLGDLHDSLSESSENRETKYNVLNYYHNIIVKIF